MALKIHSTADAAFNGVKLLVYGAAGSGKTKLCATLPKPIILSAEAGLLSLAKFDLPYIPVGTIAELQEAYEWLISDDPDAAEYETVALDSISEIAETILNYEKKVNKDPRAAYGAMQEQIADLIRAFRDIPNKHVYMSAKLEKSQDEMGRILYAPSMPGNKAGQALPYFFDEVLAIRVEKGTDGTIERYLQTSTDGLWNAKDRSGALDMWEELDLGAIIGKIAALNDKPKQETKSVTKRKAALRPKAKATTKTKAKAAEPDVDFEVDVDVGDNDD
jgi:hypothetical protein